MKLTTFIQILMNPYLTGSKGGDPKGGAQPRKSGRGRRGEKFALFFPLPQKFVLFFPLLGVFSWPGQKPATFSQKHGLCPFRCSGVMAWVLRVFRIFNLRLMTFWKVQGAWEGAQSKTWTSLKLPHDHGGCRRWVWVCGVLTSPPLPNSNPPKIF